MRANTDPVAVASADGHLSVFTVGTNNQLYYKTQTTACSSTWSSTWTSLGGPVRANTDPVVIANSDGRVQVFVEDVSNQLYYKMQIASNPS